MFDLDEDEPVVGTHFHMNGFAKCVLTESKGNLEMAGFCILSQNATWAAHITLISNLSHRNTKNIAVINTTKQRVDYFFFCFRLLMYLHPILLNHTTPDFSKLHYISIKTSLTVI